MDPGHARTRRGCLDGRGKRGFVQSREGEGSHTDFDRELSWVRSQSTACYNACYSLLALNHVSRCRLMRAEFPDQNNDMHTASYHIVSDSPGGRALLF